MIESKQILNFENRIKTYYTEEQKLCKRLKLSAEPMINFKKKKLSISSRLALFLLRKNRAFFDLKFTNLKK